MHMTRAVAAREAAFIAASVKEAVPQQLSSITPAPTTNRKKKNKCPPRESSDTNEKAVITPVSHTRKRKRKSVIEEPDANELPHNLDTVSAIENGSLSISAQVGLSTTPLADSTAKETKPGPLPLGEQPAADETTANLDVAPDELPTTKRGRKTKTNPYGLTPGLSPYPEWPHPTAGECEEVNRLLSGLHGEIKVPKAIPAPSLIISGCGEVPSVLDALIRTLLSGATSGTNSAMAFQGLVNKFGILQEGSGKGSVDWNKVHRAPVEDVYQAMKSGGLGVAKSRYIKQILDMVYQENMERRKASMKVEDEGHESITGGDKTQRKKWGRVAQTDDHVLSLDHLHALSKDEAMMEFLKYPGIGVKTAACVILFCLQRPCFAVDTHVFRISKWLGWVPPEKVNEITTFSHLEVCIPDHLKYSLHQLFLRHGKSCPRCRAITGETSEGWDKGCVIDHLVKRTGKRKGGVDSQQRKKAKGTRKANANDDEEADELELAASDS